MKNYHRLPEEKCEQYSLYTLICYAFMNSDLVIVYSFEINIEISVVFKLAGISTHLQHTVVHFITSFF